MKLYIMRHGDALEGPFDDERPLSADGLLEAGRAGMFLEKSGIRLDEIYHSTLLRSRQTALEAGRHVGCVGRPPVISERKGLRPSDDVREFASRLDASTNRNILIVGHQPFVSRLVSLLLSGDEESILIKFPTGAVTGLENSASGTLWSLRFHVTALLIRKGCGFAEPPQ
ncbi:MAG: phosphohistidine phosphatase SixA [Synergistaceae bacterium]|jgi:phosphohistidine phosphatase|nr:phosphohistidine phosphatase SixA [Synergistaceae bacterium]